MHRYRRSHGIDGQAENNVVKGWHISAYRGGKHHLENTLARKNRKQDAVGRYPRSDFIPHALNGHPDTQHANADVILNSNTEMLY
jgi:hypothetical protein